MRFSSAVRKRLQKDITVTEVGRHTTVQDQARLLVSRQVITSSSTEKRAGAPTAAEMVHCHGHGSKEFHTRELALPLLAILGLGWDSDVEDVIPAPDTLYVYSPSLLALTPLQYLVGVDTLNALRICTSR